MLLCYCASAFANPAVTYGSQMRPLTISENGYVATLTYDASGDRVREVVKGECRIFVPLPFR